MWQILWIWEQLCPLPLLMSDTGCTSQKTVFLHGYSLHECLSLRLRFRHSWHSDGSFCCRFFCQHRCFKKEGTGLKLAAKIFRKGFSLCDEQEKVFIVVAADSQSLITLTGFNGVFYSILYIQPLCVMWYYHTTSFLHVLVLQLPLFFCKLFLSVCWIVFLLNWVSILDFHGHFFKRWKGL